MKASQALAELEKLGSAHDPVFYHPFREGDVTVETPVDEVVHSPGMGGKEAREIRLDYWGVDRCGKFRLIQNGTLSGMLRERKRTIGWQRRVRRTLKRCPTCRQPIEPS